MSFCVQVKKEIAEISDRNGCCSFSHLYGMLLFAKVFSLSAISIASEHAFVVAHAKNALLEFGIQPELIHSSKSTRDHSIRITDKQVIDRIFFDFGYTGEEPNLRIVTQNFLCDSCFSAFIAGCFLTGGNITHPDKGYHLEFLSSKTNLLKDLSTLLIAADFLPRQTTRGYAKVLYFKNSAQIEDMLTVMGAVQSSLELMNTKIYKGIVNTVNRRTNCESANIDKIVNAAANDRADIEYIYKQKGKGNLPEDLRQVAQLRIDYPELPLGELGALLPTPLSKSGVSHRLRRLREHAAELREQEETDETI